MKFSNKVYDILKFIAQIVLPAIATFYVTIASIWGLPLGDKIIVDGVKVFENDINDLVLKVNI